MHHKNSYQTTKTKHLSKKKSPKQKSCNFAFVTGLYVIVTCDYDLQPATVIVQFYKYLL